MNDAVFLAAVLALGILSGATAAVVGFGIGSLLTPLLLVRLEPHVAVTAAALPHLVATAVRYVQHRRWIDRAILLRFGIPSAVGSLLGALLQGRLESPVLITMLALLLISTGFANLTRGFGGWRPGSLSAVAVGTLSGIFGGLVGNQGGLRAAGLSAFNLAPRPYLATGTAVALLIDLVRTPIYLTRGAAGLRDVALPILLATAGCLAGTIFGESLFLRMSPERYRRVVGFSVLVLGISLLV